MTKSMTTTAGDGPFQPHWDLYPRTYVAQKTSFPLFDALDGDLTKDVWADVPFSDLFDDIRGAVDAPEDERPNVNCQTRFKALWDDNHLYIGAILESDFETRAHFTRRNSPIYQKDSDFEVFVDPWGSCHDYKELEVNAINTIWNLLLDRPYDDNGQEHSGRIANPGDKNYYEVYHQKTATKLLRGTLNDPSGSATWSIEVALSFQDLTAKSGTDNGRTTMGPPSEGSIMRINFSRVEREGAINWTWQPQIVWDPARRRYSGYVAMHLPDAWGYMVLGGPASGAGGDIDQTKPQKDEAPIIPRDPSWPGRLAAMNIYYSQKLMHQRTNGRYASTIDELRDLVDPAIVGPFDIRIKLIDDGFLATASGNPDGSLVSVTHDRLVSVVHPTTHGSNVGYD
jgi:hypothetical protein